MGRMPDYANKRRGYDCKEASREVIMKKSMRSVYNYFK